MRDLYDAQTHAKCHDPKIEAIDILHEHPCTIMIGIEVYWQL